MKVTTNGFFGTNSIGIPGLAQAPRQKGRPRKRKPKDIEALTANLGKLCFVSFFFFLICYGFPFFTPA